MRMVSRLVLALTVLVAIHLAAPVAAPTPAMAQRAAPAANATDAREIRRVIRTQLDALRRDDAKTAFEQAAPSIQHRYATPDFFLKIVKRHYTPVYKAKAATFGRLAMWRGSLTQEVAIVAEDGQRYTAFYPMRKLPGGAWRIAGCMILKDSSI